LESIGIVTPLQVLEHLPRRYESFAYTASKETYEDKERLVILGKLRGTLSHPLRFSHRSLYRFYFESKEGQVFLIEAWNRDYLGKILVPGETYTLSGVYEKKRHSLALINIVKGEIAPEKALKPIYALPDGVSQYLFSRMVDRVLTLLSGKVGEVIPECFSKKYRLPPVIGVQTRSSALFD
jgi:RecG-like helicase